MRLIFKIIIIPTFFIPGKVSITFYKLLVLSFFQWLTSHALFVFSFHLRITKKEKKKERTKIKYTFDFSTHITGTFSHYPFSSYHFINGTEKVNKTIRILDLKLHSSAFNAGLGWLVLMIIIIPTFSFLRKFVLSSINYLYCTFFSLAYFTYTVCLLF